MFTEEAKDLISKLLVRDPRQRLGAGRVGSNNDFDVLKKHKFFYGIDFDKIFLLPSPVISKNYNRTAMIQQLIDSKS